MTGRARGRARGRSRGAGATDTTRPGKPQQPQQQPLPAAQQQVGRGSRGRGGGAAKVQEKPPQQRPPQQQPPPQQQQQQERPSPPVEQMKAMAVSKKEPSPPSAVSGASRGGRGRFTEPVTRPEHIQDKRGTTGRAISVVSNYVTLKSRPNSALYQYNVSFSPAIESKKLRFALLYSYEGIGKTKAFDGMILYLPHKLPDQVTKFTTKTQREEMIEITITLTNELSVDSPICLQLFNVIFRR